MAMTKIPELDYELIGGDTVRLEQGAAYGEAVIVDLHLIHVRLLAQEMGLLRGSPDQAQRVQALERRLRVLRDRIDRLDDALLIAAEKGHEDLTEECAMSAAALDLADEFIADLANAITEIEPIPNPPGSPGFPNAQQGEIGKQAGPVQRDLITDAAERGRTQENAGKGAEHE